MPQVDSAPDTTIRVVALVGFLGRLKNSPTRLFERCGLRLLNLETARDASRVLSQLRADVVVVDSHHDDLKQTGGELEEMLAALGHARDRRSIDPTPLVVLRATGVSDPLISRYRECGAVFLSSADQSLRRIALEARRLSGLPGTCCR